MQDLVRRPGGLASAASARNGRKTRVPYLRAGASSHRGVIRSLSLMVAAAAAFAMLSGGTAWAAPAAATGPAAAAGVTYGVAAATQLTGLPYLEPGVLAGGQSSFDRNTGDASHGNSDLNNFLATGPGGNVMLDQRGPGCVYRIWMTSLQDVFPSDWVKIYFDGSSVPAIDLTVAQMFSGTVAPFLAPLVANNQQSSGGYVSYVPLCYRSSIKIVTNMDRYYNIGYLTYPPGSDVTTWTPAQNTSAMQAEWSHVTTDPIGTRLDTPASGTLTLDAGAGQTLLHLTGAHTIEAIKIAIAGVPRPRERPRRRCLTGRGSRSTGTGRVRRRCSRRWGHSSPSASSARRRRTGWWPG